MSDLMKAWLLPRPVFAPDGDGGGETDDKDTAGVEKEETVTEKAADDATDAAETSAAEWKEYEPDPEKSDEDNATAKAEHDRTKPTAASDAADKGDKPNIGLTDDMRDAVAGDDAELRKLLSRYTTVRSLAQALKNAQAKISTGKVQTDMPDPKNEKAMAEWRKARGIPDDPTGYKLPETVTKRMTDEDKPLISAFTEYAHGKNADPAAVAIATEWYFDTLEKMQADTLAEDNKAKETADDELRKEWAPAEFKANMKLGSSFLETIPGVGKGWTEARMPDGRRLGDIPEFVIWAAEMGRAEFGDPTFATTDSAERHTSRIAEIEKIRDTDFDRYEREGLDKEMVGLREKELKRGKAA